LLSLDHISMQYGGRSLFDDLSLVLGPHDRIGLVGSNGAGKSTLLKVIAGIIPPDEGLIGKAHYVTVGYLPQDGVIARGTSLYKEVEMAFEDVLDVRQKLEEAQDRLASLPPESDEYADTLGVYGELHHRLEDLDAYRMQSKIERILMGLGFAVEDFRRDTGEFSGGWQMRIALAKLLLKEPSVLLLDEPTNHLDIESLQWFEQYLTNYDGTVVLVSHDRRFLDTITTSTLALSMGKMEVYAGNYSFYVREKAVRKELASNAFKNQQQQLKQTREFIDRFRYKATKARQVQSRIKQLEKMDLIELEDDEEEIHFDFPTPQPSGRTVMELKRISKSYGDNRVFRELDYDIEKGDKIAVVGVNGAGKSTLVRILAGVEPLDAGERVLGYHVILSYFAQHQAEELDLSKDALEILDDAATGEVRKKLRTILGSFLFHGDDVFKRVEVLSGGEKSRLALAKMLLQPSNFLIMDEPTNHLDMRSKNVLQEALMKFPGTFVIVSHDRAFLDPIVNKVLEIRRGGIRTYPGTVSEYLDKLKSERKNAADPPGGTPSPSGPAPVPPLSGKARKRLEAERRQEFSRRLKPAREKLRKIEEEMGTMERRKVEIEALMAEPDFYKNGTEARNISHEYKEIQGRLNDAYHAWNSLTLEIEHLENRRDS
jgi:ATP-binding cassette, subfamily F, member 3